MKKKRKSEHRDLEALEERACGIATLIRGAAASAGVAAGLWVGTDAGEESLAEQDVVRQLPEHDCVDEDTLPLKGLLQGVPMVCCHVVFREPVEWLVRSNDHACDFLDVLY